MPFQNLVRALHPQEEWNTSSDDSLHDMERFIGLPLTAVFSTQNVTDQYKFIYEASSPVLKYPQMLNSVQVQPRAPFTENAATAIAATSQINLSKVCKVAHRNA